MSLNPVALRPGRGRLSTNPIAMGSPTLMNTIGIVDVWCIAATDAPEPLGINSSAPRPNTSATAFSGSPLIHTTSSTTSWFSTRPTCRKPSRNALTSDWSYTLDCEPKNINAIRTGPLPDCARAANGHAAAAPPSSVMKSRRFTAGTSVLPLERIAHPQLRQETAALRDFAPAYVGSGSVATDEVEITRSRMSASPLKADN